MIDPELLQILACPDNRESMTLAPEDLVTRLNSAIAAGKITNRGGEPVRVPLEGGLVRGDRRYLYPIRDDIPILLVEEAIPLPLPASP